MSGDPMSHPQARWVGPPERASMTWLSVPRSGATGSGVLVLPPVGYEWWSTHRTLRVLAEALADGGHLVARLEYHGTGDSAGAQTEEGRVAAWRQGVADAVADLRAQGCDRVSLVGVRVGGLLALLDGHDLGADAIALWSPVVTGRRWARTLRLMADDVPTGDADVAPGSLSVAGVLFSAETLADLSALSATGANVAPAPRVLVVGDPPDAKLTAHLESLGVEVAARRVPGADTPLDMAAEDAVVPEELVAAVRAWFGTAAGVPPAEVRSVGGHDAQAVLRWGRGAVEERVVRLGDHGLVAVRCAPAEVEPAASTLVFLNTGSEPHVGPGRAWVELARTLALRGHVSYRVDWRGWGESPSAGHAPGRPYDPHTVQDTVDLVRALQHEGHRDVVLCGLCASAWVALRAALEVDVAGVVALNPQMYWQPGDPVEATMAETRRRRTEEIAEFRAGAACGRWEAEDRAGERPWAAAWLDQLAALPTRITLLFAEGDDGLEYLATRLPLRLAAARAAGVDVVELEDVDHSMHRFWKRGVVADAIERAVARAGSATMRAGT